MPHSNSPIAPSEITPKALYLNRRQLMAAGVAAGLLGARASLAAPAKRGAALAATRNPSYVAIDKLTPYENATTYNNFYEFGTDKSDPAYTAQMLKPRPWQLRIEGEVLKPQTFDLDALLKLAPMEERIYRLRCVEGWSMVIPWIGYSLSTLINKAQPKGNAKFVEFISLADKDQMPGVRVPVLQWPYTEGLRLDEAMHPLTLLSLGMYGEVLPNQNGAPVRLVVPWKYGFKSAKSIVTIRLTEKQPISSWMRSAPSEYGFYSNVNPTVDHPRWSQATERRLPDDGLFAPKRKTLMFNGYDQVASLYSGMDLRKQF